MKLAIASFIFALPVLAAATTGCKKSSADSSASSTAPPASTPEPTSAAVKPVASPCPPATTKGTGTSYGDPCLATGATRMIQFTWTGKIGERPEFTMKNLSGRPITNVSTNVYFYDKGGTILTVKKGHMVPGWTGAYKLGATETKTLEMGAVKADIPAGAAAIEAEAQGVQFDTGEFGKDVYWANYDLSSYQRPKGGPK